MNNYRYGLLRRIVSCMCISVILVSMCVTDVFAASTKKISAGTLQKGLQYTLTNMPYNGKYCSLNQKQGYQISSVQNFAITPDNKYIFTVSECRKGGKKHTLLTRCAIPKSKGANAKAVCQDSIVLKGYGHGEAIAVTARGKKAYDIWVACTPKGNCGTEIARLTYSMSGKKGKITKTVVIKDFRKANAVYDKKTKKMKAAYFDKKPVPDRLNVAIDTKSNQIAFRVHFKNGGCNYVFYDYKKLNAALNKVKNKGSYNISKAVSLQRANVRSSLVPYNTFQSFTIDGKNLYTCGGHMNKGAEIWRIPYKIYPNGKVKIQNLKSSSAVKQKYAITPQITVDGQTLKKDALEIEGLKLINGRFYVNFVMKDIPIRESIGIYSFTK
ncbi:hypothetical protein FMM74_010070 [Lachnospiraceae bacterium MD308]|nr:hypothetical protein [Lachnospiraceae bacterium MD308]